MRGCSPHKPPLGVNSVAISHPRIEGSPGSIRLGRQVRRAAAEGLRHLRHRRLPPKAWKPSARSRENESGRLLRCFFLGRLSSCFDAPRVPVGGGVLLQATVYTRD